MDAKLFAYLSYADAPAALTWLRDLGFTVVRRQDGEGNQVIHSELRLGEVVVMVSSFDEDYVTAPLLGRSTGRGLYLLVDDVDAFFGRAIAAGGTSVIGPEDTDWGSRRARVLDQGGLEWSFGSYEPGVRW
ncbi:bleomycin resistance protein [Cryobacterium lactosi]|uniref:Bleomycin resistance protein n=1 Tax=Cryobacterium lactosi TaxID=1259202 RepID=A0A4R9BFP1_9MICO|nr:VOC family protein [Cryobacterium lactosi]TFD83186.1 bleomycin resistance protein [Cryobacterium lactosi]